MWRDIDPRAPERERPEPGLGRVGGYSEMESGQAPTTRVTCSRATSTCHEGRQESASA